MLPKERSRLPRTDTRFRPDQRALEVKNSEYIISFLNDLEFLVGYKKIDVRKMIFHFLAVLRKERYLMLKT